MEQKTLRFKLTHLYKYANIPHQILSIFNVDPEKVTDKEPIELKFDYENPCINQIYLDFQKLNVDGKDNSDSESYNMEVD